MLKDEKRVQAWNELLTASLALIKNANNQLIGSLTFTALPETNLRGLIEIRVNSMRAGLL